MHVDSQFPFRKPRAQTVSDWWIAAEERSVEARRRAHATQLACELSSRADVAAAPGLVQNFLVGQWSRVLAHVRLCDMGPEREQRYREAIDHLLWSVQPDVTLRRPVELLERLPALICTLREGLSLITASDEARSAFLDGLMRLHRPALKVRRAKARRDDDGAGHARASQFADTLVSELAALEVARMPAERLRIGDSFYLRVQGSWIKARLHWISDNRQLLLFISRGGRSHSMTRRTCERLLHDDELIPTHRMQS